MGQVGAAAVCAIIALTAVIGFVKELPVFTLFCEGAGSGAETAFRLLPTLIGLITAITMLRASGVIELITHVLEPMFGQLGMDPEIVPLVLLRPLSGSGAVSYVTELMAEHGADADVSRMAAILSSSTETTFYAAAVYFGGRGYRSVCYTVPAALCGDLAAVVLSVLSIRLFG